ncbi:uncharacterized protein [Clytia hemisphaerica]|uniref:uncharacterized protein n=1 Tax=Clytia hemisphaerica TaxID=252671 RepID=UPI0034D43547
MTGVFGCNLSVYFHVKETLQKTPSKLDSRLLHSNILIINGASIFTMSLLCIERLRAILKPLKHHKNMRAWKLVLLIIITWFLATILIIPYFVYGFIRYLAFFSATSVTLTFIFLMVTTAVYKNHFKASTTGSEKRSTRDSNYFRTSSLDSWLAENHSNQPSPRRVPLRFSSCPEPSTSLEPDFERSSLGIRDRTHPISKEVSFFGKIRLNFFSCNTDYNASKSASSEKTSKSHLDAIVCADRGRLPGKFKPRITSIKTNQNLLSTIPVNENQADNISTNQNSPKTILRHSTKNRSITQLIRNATRGRGTEKSTSKSSSKRSERRIHKCFLKMALVFLVTYLPAVLMTIYMNLCLDCDCILIHVLRDLTTISLLASAALRPINFMLTLKTLRKAISKWFDKTKRQNGGGRHVTMSVSSADYLDSFHGSPYKFQIRNSGSPAHFQDRKRMVTI